MAEVQTTVRWEELISIGRVARPQGRFGEIVLDAVADPNAIEQLERVFVVEEPSEPAGPGEPRRHVDGHRAIAVRNVRVHKGRPVLRLEGTDDISSAQRLSGLELRVESHELGTLPEGRFFNYQLVGLQVWDPREGSVGVVKDCVTTGGSDLLVVESETAAEVLIPFCRELCPEVDLERKRIVTNLPEGLVAVNAD